MAVPAVAEWRAELPEWRLRVLFMEALVALNSVTFWHGGLQPSLDPPGLGSRSNSLQGPPPPGVGLNNFQPPVPPPRQPTPDAQKEPRQIGLGGGLGLGGGALGGGLGGGVFGATSTW